MTETLQSALSPLFIIGSFYNLCPFEYPFGRPWPFLSCLYAWVIWGSIMYFNSYYSLFNNWKFIGISVETNYNWIAISLIFISFYRFKELKMCLHELSILDDTLEALGSPKKYQWLRNWIIRIIIGWIVYMFSDVLTLVFYLHRWIYTTNRAKQLYVTFIINHPKYINILSLLICGTVLGYTSYRFSQVNDRLYVLYSDLFEDNADYKYRRQNRCILVRQRITEAKDRQQTIWIIMHVHLQLCLISRKLNKVFNIQILLQLVWYFTEVAFAYIDTYMILEGQLINNEDLYKFQDIIGILLIYSVHILYSILFLTINYICQSIYHKINETVVILHKLSNYNLDEALREQCSWKVGHMHKFYRMIMQKIGIL